MNSIYYYKGVSGRTRFVTFNRQSDSGRNNKLWTNEKVPILKDSIDDLKLFKHLKGKRVELNGHIGIIQGCNPIDKQLDGKYLGSNFYASKLLNVNNLVQVHWLTGTNYCWQPFYKLKLI